MKTLLFKKNHIFLIRKNTIKPKKKFLEQFKVSKNIEVFFSQQLI